MHIERTSFHDNCGEIMKWISLFEILKRANTKVKTSHTKMGRESHKVERITHVHVERVAILGIDLG